MNFHPFDLVRSGTVEFTVLRVTPAALVVLDKSIELNWPEVFPLEDAITYVEQGSWTVDVGEPPAVTLDHELTERQREKRDADWEIVKPIVENDGIFDPKQRPRLIKEAAADRGISTNNVRKLLRRFFHRGMSKSALTVAWSRCGAPGKIRPPGAVKRGRPVAPDHPPGVNVTEEHRRQFERSLAATYRKDKRFDLPGAYRYYLARYAMTSDVADPRKPRFIERFAADGPPKFAQFVYWVKQQDWERVLERRQTPRVYQKTRRPLLGTSTAEAFGPCSRFQIDATVLRVYVRSRANRHHLVGRPTLYLMIDVFSRMIVGFSLSFEPASWLSAMTALAHSIEDKVAFCASFGIAIEKEEWPAQHACGVLLGDNGGELKGSFIAKILETFRIDVQNAGPYRADWKGVVERRFGLIEAGMGPYTPGFVEPDFLERGAKDYRGEAVLDLDEVMQNLIELVLYFNNEHELVGYPAHPGQVEDDVPSVPAQLWRWGIANRTGSPRMPDPEKFRFALLPTGMATVTRQGLRFDGRFYALAPDAQRRLSQRALNGRFQVPVSCDDRDADRLYVHDKNARSGFQVASLTDRSAQHRGFNAGKPAVSTSPPGGYRRRGVLSRIWLGPRWRSVWTSGRAKRRRSSTPYPTEAASRRR